MLSTQLTEERGLTEDLLLHLIASHHGYARPFAPVVDDDKPPDVKLGDIGLTSAQRTANPPYRLGSGIAERFWHLIRRHGWWGLAYLEALLRLADHHASRFPRPVAEEAANA